VAIGKPKGCRMHVFVRLIATFVIGGIGAFFIGLGIVCYLEGNGWGCSEFIFWGILALVTAIVLWKKPAWLFGWILPDF
jgi:hypothetical protein